MLNQTKTLDDRYIKQRKRDAVFLSSRGDFDGSCAYELLHSLGEQCDGVNKVIVDTDGLSRIHPFGRDTLNNNIFLLKGKEFRLKFIGHHAEKIAPEERQRRLMGKSENA